MSYTDLVERVEELEERVAELERMIGRLTLQLDMAKKVLGYSGFPPKENE